MPDIGPLLNEKQAAELLSVTVRTMQSWRVTGGGPPYVKLGRAVRYIKSDLEAWILKGKRQNTSFKGVEND